MDNKKDPVLDRKEFEKRLNKIFINLNPNDLQDVIRYILLNDSVSLEKYSSKLKEMTLKKDSYLKEYDACANDEERTLVVAKVKR